MKKIFAVLLTLALIVSLAACGKSEKKSEATAAPAATTAEKTVEAPKMVGGWQASDSPVITDSVKALLDKATQGLTGAEYTPVAYLGTQVVAGTNHRILCKKTLVTAEPVTTYAILTVYENLDGGAEVTDIADCNAEAVFTGESGSWSEPDSPVVTDEAKAALTKATKDVTGAEYTPVALLGTQIVSGTNYRLLCLITPVTENPEPYYAVVTVYEDLNGNASITETADFSDAPQSTEA